MMSNASMLPAIELFRYYAGQSLASRDLNDYLQSNHLRRRIHNAALHNAWGVATGFEIVKHETENTATIAPGVAYDHYGREIVLAKTVMLELPNSAEAFFLVVRLKNFSLNAGPKACDNAGSNEKITTPFGEPEFFWRREDDISFGVEIPLARLEAGKLARTVGIDARPEATPRLGFGATQSNLTAWRFYKETITTIDAAQNKIVTKDITLGLEVDINTTDAGFVERPCYFATLSSHRFALKTPLFPTISLANERHDGFTFRAMLQFSPIKSSIQAIERTADTLISPQMANELGLIVCWLGVQFPSEI